MSVFSINFDQNYITRSLEHDYLGRIMISKLPLFLKFISSLGKMHLAQIYTLWHIHTYIYIYLISMRFMSPNLGCVWDCDFVNKKCDFKPNRRK
jgi:hypothetical protein